MLEYVLRRARVRPLAITAIVALMFYMAWPALTSTHLEGYTAQVQSLAIAMTRGRLVQHDLDLPLISQYLLFTRPGVVAILAAIDLLRSMSDDLGFRLLTIVSLATLLAGSCVFVWRWSNARPETALLVLLLTPGVLAFGFYYNDNIVSSAFAAAAAAAIGRKSRLATFVVAGALIAGAMLCRIDALLIVPLIAGLAPMQRATVRHVSLAAGAFLLGWLGVLAIASWWLGFTPLDSLAMARHFALPVSKHQSLAQGVFFFGLISPPLIALGILHELVAVHPFATWRADLRRVWRVAMFVFFPAMFMAYALLSAAEMRYFFPLLTPLIALLGSEGFGMLGRYLVRGRWRTGARLAAAGLASSFFLPPLAMQLRDGPSMLVGNVWSPILWRRWQRVQEQGLAATLVVVDDLKRQRNGLAVTTRYSDEFFLRLRLMESGYVGVETSDAFPGCGGFSTYRLGGHQVMHVRLEPEYGRSKIPVPVSVAVLMSSAFNCPALRSAPYGWVMTSMLDIFQLGLSEFQDTHFPTSRLQPAVTGEAAAARALFVHHESLSPLRPVVAIRVPGPELAALARSLEPKITINRRRLVATRAALLSDYRSVYRAIPLGRWQGTSEAALEARP